MDKKRLYISNFKSIKEIEINCGRINVFIGEPNTGKSNILEALGFMSLFVYFSYGKPINFVRHERPLNIFYDETIDEPVVIRYDSYSTDLRYEQSRLNGIMKINDPNSPRQIVLGGDYNSINSFHQSHLENKFRIRYYKYIDQTDYSVNIPELLLPPNGRNLVSLILTNKKLKQFVDELLKPYGLRMVVKPQENKLEIIKLMEDIIITYPYSLLSDTLKRVIFHMAAILSNKNATLVFEEPESHAFPYHTKYLAEKIALDNANNEYFIATHNPYFLLTLLEKTTKEDIQIFLTYFEDYQTKVKPLTDKQKENLLRMDTDVFFQLEELLV